MKTFVFRLEQALRWRAAQVDLEKGKVAEAAGLLARTRKHVSVLREQLAEASASLSRAGSEGSLLAAWPAWEKRMLNGIEQSQRAATQAEASLAERMKLLAEANRRFQLLENMRDAGKAKWTAEFTRELESFAAESFLGRLQVKRTGG